MVITALPTYSRCMWHRWFRQGRPGLASQDSIDGQDLDLLGEKGTGLFLHTVRFWSVDALGNRQLWVQAV
ncbi:hypothetical protein PVE_P0004 (plasmid) [Pseudomonas veronii 1YdBTEX2]|uniref:Uncharacterized protein n=1 Tax=Pseudomonas veronii 1YdBTEX2 TaxID=1295141 RepID=A0A1D3K9L8_PSEVE|nr:hypothetical protein PVE_P0004 [Pseudomonas veronii 1YdBTEX2]